ncbi:response regulator [uncultured Cohaesibacter sp.]|uniref:response regulator n=1 Tax=uncultured Cohaesibacter sp. TaxID=1002546 RepID=UPI00292F4A4E|nr:response regulator [uncultured Cohaesibacter sp.]
MNSLILIVEDDPEIGEILNAYLMREGFRTVKVVDGRAALELHLALKPDLLLLDINIPRLDGWEVLSEVRRRGNTPVMIITALDQDVDRLQGLRIGADDFIVKPFNPVEVVARAKAILRRAGMVASDGILRIGMLAIDLDSYQVKVERRGDPVAIALTLTEFRLLAHMAKTPTKVFSRSELVDACLSDDNALDRTVDSHVSNLRKKLHKAGIDGILPGVRGVGYRLTDKP